MRVIAGLYRSRPLKPVPGKNTRPTTDKIKESIFNLLATEFPYQGKCLDFYAGSGALGIEAVSRGLSQAVLCEKFRPAIQTIQANIEMTQEEDKFTLLTGNNRQSLSCYLQKQAISFDLVFLDPPYASSQIAEDLAWLSSQKALAPGCLVVCEGDQDHTLGQLPYFSSWKQKQYGITIIQIYRFVGLEGEENTHV